MAKYAVEGEDYVEVNMVESTKFYMNWEDFAPTYRAEYCEFSGIDPATCANYTEADMVEKVWGGQENAEATKYRVGPLCSSQKKDPNVYDECGDGCGEGSCCIEWNFFQINDPELPYFKNLGITSDFVRKTCSDAKSSAIMSQYAVEGEDYAEVNMVESTNFYMNWENFAANYREEYCQFSGIDPATCVNYTESDMVENVWGGRENAEATKYRVGPLCSNSESATPNPNIHDECGEGCGEGSCCIEWNFFQINDPELPYFKNLGITSDFVRKTCSTPKSNALMAQYAVEGEDYVEVNMVESTNFYMNWEDFAPTYRAEYCEFSGIDPVTCSNYTENDMVEKVWGGKENAEATKYRVGPLCSRAG